MAEMLFSPLWPDGGGYASVAAGLEAFRREQVTPDELRSVVALSFEASPHHAVGLSGRLAEVPLRVHARYQSEEIVVALGYASLQRRPNSLREGVLYVPELDVDAFFVTPSKSEADYSPTTLYLDYRVSPTLSHWESQSTTSVSSPTGQRYLTGSSTVLLFVRKTESDESGTAPYLLLGPARYVEHSGNRPIAITRELEHPMPTDFFTSASVVAGWPGEEAGSGHAAARVSRMEPAVE